MIKAIDHSREVMLDLETLGKKPGCPILAIGASTLDGKSTFYSAISRQSCKRFGLIEDPDTVAWWKSQSYEAQNAAFSGTLSLSTVLNDFADWLILVSEWSDPAIWGNGASFDAPVLQAAYEAVGIAVPWSYRNERCYRTLAALYPWIAADGTNLAKHNALADAQHQAAHAYKILASLNGAN